MHGARRLGRLALVAAAAACLAACASAPPSSLASGPPATPKAGPPYQVNGIWYVPRMQPNYDEVGTASWYGDAFHGRPTADGEIFDMNAVSGAHTTLPLPCLVEVTNLDNGRKLIVRVNDRGPFVGARLIDLSHEAARQLGYDRQGLARVRVRYVGPAPLLGPEAGVRIAQARPRPAPAAAPPARYASAQPYRPRASSTVEAPVAARFAPPPVPAPVAAPSEQAVFTSAPLPGQARRLQIVRAIPDAQAQAAAPKVYRVQAGAFSDEGRARSVAARLSRLGSAAVEATQRSNGSTLYRVVLPSTSDVAQANDLRARVAEAGYAEAVVVGPL